MLNWVIGSRGLLGSSVSDELLKSGKPWHPSTQMIWAKHGDAESIAAMEHSIMSAVEEFASAQSEQAWSIFWCAGIGVVNSPNELLDLEIMAVRHLTSSLKKFGLTSNGVGRIFFASSAGGVYAGSLNPPFTEATPVVPISNYGRQKIAIEDLLLKFGEECNTKIIIGRIANLYGVKQNQHKQQGIVTALVRSSLTNTIMNIYVPLNTIRNYIFAPDAACQIVSQVMEMDEPARLVVICSKYNWSLSTILRMTQDVMRKRLCYFQSSREATMLQPIDLRLATQYVSQNSPTSEVPLIVGINNIRLHLLDNLQKGITV